MPPGCCRPAPSRVFLQPSEQTPPRLCMRPPPVRAQALLPPIPPGLLPVIVKAWGHLGKRMVGHRVESLAPLWQAARGLRCAVGMGKARPPRPDQTAKAGHNTLSLAFPCGKGLVVLHRSMAGRLAAAPTPWPYRRGPCHAGLMLLGFPPRLARPALGEQGRFEVSPAMLHCRAMGGLPAGLRRDRLARVGQAWRVIRAGRGL
jgi:hypothetical protein